MEISTEYNARICILHLSGELDASNAVEIDGVLLQLIARKPEHIWINGENISYISSAGLGVFLSHLQTLTQEKISFVFFGLNAKIRNVFTILGLDSLIRIVADRKAAETLFNAQSAILPL